MATGLSRYLRLKLDSNLTANARYNLERIDELGAVIIPDSTNQLNVRSEANIQIEPESPDLGGSGSGGQISLGTDEHEIDLLAVYATLVNFSASIGLLDQASGGSKYLRMRYKSDLSGSVDTTADRLLSLDMQGADRSVTLGGDLSTSGGNLSLALASNLAWSIPANSAGYLSNNGSGTLTWSSISGAGDVMGENHTWVTADGATKVITHTLASDDVEIQIYDESDDLIWIDSVSIDSTSQITLTASETPASSWRVVLQAKP